MTFLAAQPIEQRQAEQVQALTPSDPDGFKPGFFSGSGTAIGTGFGRVGAVASEMVGNAGYLAGSTFVTKPIDALFDTDLTGFIDQKMRQEPAQLTASMTPDPYTTGSLGQILYGFVGIGVPAAVGTYFGGPAGGAAMAGGFQATGTYTDLTQQGVDPNTAGAAALFDGSLAGVGVGVPASIGRRALLNTLLYGPGINVAQDLIAGQGMSAILEKGGYSEMAERYAEIDGEMLAADAILGAAFGWHGARTGRAGRVARTAPTQTEIDAGLAAMNRRHAEVDTAPGTPADLLAVQSHVRNLESATAAILDGRRVEVEPTRGEFLARPEQVIPAPDEFVRAIRESGLPGLMDDIDALEAEMTKRGRVLPDEELPDVRRVAAAADAAAIETGRTAEAGPLKVIERDVGGVRVREIEQTRAAVDAAEATGKAGDLLRAVGKHAAGDDQRMLAGRLASVADKAGLSVIKPPDGARHAGAYLAGDHAMYVQQAKPSIVLHEALHGVTSALLDSPEVRASNPQVRAAYDDMRGILNDAQAALRDSDMRAMPAALREMLNDPQGPLSNIKELLTYGFTEKEFQRWLDTVPASKKAGAATAWQAFKDTIKKLIGKLSPGERTLLDDLIESGGQLIDAAGADPAAVKRAAGGRAGAAETVTMGERVAASVVAENPGLTLPDGVVADYSAVSREQIESPEFRRWFGDSKVVDANGEPLVVYHGTTADFDTFRPSVKFGESYFASEESGYANAMAFGDGGNVMPLYFSLLNPLEVPYSNYSADTLETAWVDNRDGVIATDENGVKKVVVAFRPEQIKSATANNGNFDPSDPRIDYAKINTAADALEQADAAIARAENDSTGFEAAIACFMRNGA